MLYNGEKFRTGNKETGHSMSASESYWVVHFVIKEEKKSCAFLALPTEARILCLDSL
jgi:hypothetical protein